MVTKLKIIYTKKTSSIFRKWKLLTCWESQVNSKEFIKKTNQKIDKYN